MELGDLIVPTEAKGYDAVSELYAENTNIKPTRSLADNTEKILKRKRINYHQGKMISFSFIFLETSKLTQRWSSQVYLGVEMEMASSFAIADHFDVDSFGLVYIMDMTIEDQDVYEGDSELGKIREKRTYRF